MNQPLITIGLTSYNSEISVLKAIESAINQSWTNKEIIIVDDCSNDNSPKIIKSINFQGVSHKIFFQKKNKGVPTSLNKIIKEAKGSYICFFDDDDISKPERLYKQYTKLIQYKNKNNIEKIACFASTIRDYQNGYKKLNKAIGSENNVPIGKDIINFHFSKRLKKGIFYGSGTPTCSLFIKKNTFDYIGFYDENLTRSEDCDLAIRLGEYDFHFIGCEEPLIKQFIYKAEYKNGYANYKSEIKLFKKYPNYIDCKYLKYLKLWHLTKANYFSSKYLKFFFNILNLLFIYPSRSLKRIILRGIPRLIHDLRINIKFTF